MAFNAEYAGQVTRYRVERIGQELASMRSIADQMANKNTDTAFMLIRQMRRLDEIYNTVAPIWSQPDIAALKTAAEQTAIAGVKTALDDLILTFADIVAVATMETAISIGATYDPAGTRAERLAAVNRSFSDATISVPVQLSNAAASLRDAIDAFRAT